MALKWHDRILETSTTTGTGAFTLAGAVTGFKTFASRLSTNDTCYYSIEGVDAGGTPTGEWETGLGTYSGVNTLTRTTVLESSNSDAAVNFSAGTKRVMLTKTASPSTKASTTDILTGTDDVKEVTADALAALWEKGSDIASAGTISVGEGGTFHVTGTTTITDIDPATDKAGRPFILVFDGALTLTHNATTLILPGGSNILTAAGDSAIFISEGSDAVRCIAYQRGTEQSIGSGTSFPASPVTGQRFYRTDIRAEGFWDGTQWLSSQAYSLDMTHDVVAQSASFNGVTVAVNPQYSGLDLYIIHVMHSITISGTGTWTCWVRDNSGNVISSKTASATSHELKQINSVVSSSQVFFALQGTEDSGTATCVYRAAINYRHVLT